MPTSSVSFRAVCGTFYWTFQAFMRKRAHEKASMRIHCISVSAPTAVVLVFLVAFLLQCGDIESNPGPHRRQTTLTSPSQSPTTRKENANKDKSSLDDVVEMLNALNDKMTTLDKKMDNIHSSLQERMDRMENNLEDAQKENKELQRKIDTLESKLDDLEGRSRRNNLIFHGIPQPQGQTETWADCERAVQTVLKEELGMQDHIEMERAHRLRSGKGPHPIIVCFSSFKDKERVLTERRALKNKESAIFINEDFTPRVREKRRKLLPFLKEAKNANKKAFLRFDTLVIEGKTFVYDAASSGVVERGRQR